MTSQFLGKKTKVKRKVTKIDFNDEDDGNEVNI